MTAAPDRSLERYEIVDRIAVGGMAEVFRAKAFGAHGFEKTLAIKRILPDLASDPEFEQRFILEAKLAVQLAHANIVQVFDFGRVGGSLFIAMEHVEGLDLAALLRALQKRGERVPVGAALQIAIELCKGLDYAHLRGVIHRDVSPSNILLSRSGEVKIADFGIAQAERDQAKKRSKQPQRIMGKWRYMSPEQTRGDELTARSDLFSAAVCIFELFTGEKLFWGDDAEQVARNIDSMPIPYLTQRRDDLPPRLDGVLRRALQRRPLERQARAAELLRAFTEISYESNIVASAMDVADVVTGVLGDAELVAVTTEGAPHRPSGRAIDDIIKAQLGGVIAASTQVSGAGDRDRQTEQASLLQTQTTFVRKGVDAAGATMWELEGATVAAVPSAIRTGRATGPTRAVNDGASGTTAASMMPRSPRRRWLTGVLGVLAGLGVLGAGLILGRQGSRPAVDRPGAAPASTAPASDAGAPMGTLRFVTLPPGASVTVDGEALATPTPTAVDVRAGVGHQISLQREGYRPWHSQAPVTVSAGMGLLVQQTLEPRRASLRVTTRPPGARVLLDGELLGVTPLAVNELDPGAGRQLVIEKDDYRRLVETLELADGDDLGIERVLRSAVEYGLIDLFIEPGPGGGWADVYLKGRKLAEAPVKGLRLPVGRHQLKLENPESGRAKVITVEVKAGEARYYRIAL